MSSEVVVDDPVSPASESPGDTFRSFMMRLPFRRLLRFDDEVMHAHLLNKRHDFLPRSRADREHGHNRRNAENHAQHGEKRAHPMHQKILHAKLRVSRPLLIHKHQAARQHSLLFGDQDAPPKSFAPAESLALRGAVGSTSATFRPSSKPSTAARLSFWL